MTTNHNEAMYKLFSDMVPKKEKAGLDAIKLGAALAIIRYNDGFKAVPNIFQSFSPSNPLIRTKEAFRPMDNKRIMTSKNPIPWKDTFAKKEMNKAKLREQKSKYGDGLWMWMCMFQMFKRILKMIIRIFCIQDK